MNVSMNYSLYLCYAHRNIDCTLPGSRMHKNNEIAYIFTLAITRQFTKIRTTLWKTKFLWSVASLTTNKSTMSLKFCSSSPSSTSLFLPLFLVCVCVCVCACVCVRARGGFWKEPQCILVILNFRFCTVTSHNQFGVSPSQIAIISYIKEKLTT